VIQVYYDYWPFVKENDKVTFRKENIMEIPDWHGETPLSQPNYSAIDNDKSRMIMFEMLDEEYEYRKQHLVENKLKLKIKNFCKENNITKSIIEKHLISPYPNMIWRHYVEWYGQNKISEQKLDADLKKLSCQLLS